MDIGGVTVIHNQYPLFRYIRNPTFSHPFSEKNFSHLKKTVLHQPLAFEFTKPQLPRPSRKREENSLLPAPGCLNSKFVIHCLCEQSSCLFSFIW
jgi:hypothetical protein